MGAAAAGPGPFGGARAAVGTGQHSAGVGASAAAGGGGVSLWSGGVTPELPFPAAAASCCGLLISLVISIER